MIFEDTEKNMIALLQSLGTLERKQILRFFSDVMTERKAEMLLKRLANYSFLRYDETLDRYLYHNAAKLNRELADRIITSFWIPAGCGSSFIRQVYPLEYPSQLMFITEENLVYDVTVCYTENEAIQTANMRSFHRIEGVPDDINHIALVGDADLGRKLGKYGFDTFCVLDRTDCTPLYEVYE